METKLRTSAVRTLPRAAITLSGVLLRYGSIRLGWCWPVGRNPA